MTNKTIENGNIVTLHYRGTLSDGTEFDNSRERNEAITVTVGAGQLIEGFDKALDGMTGGEMKTFTVPAEEAYGIHEEQATTTLDRDVFPADFEFTDQMMVPLQGPDGQVHQAILSDVTDKTVFADFNHPMAGKDLTFEVEVLDVRSDETTST